MALLESNLPRATLVTLLAGSLSLNAAAQNDATQLAPVVVTGRAATNLGVAGWGELPLARIPMQASVLSADQAKDSGAHRLSSLLGLEAALGDAYNAEGYWDFLTVRGFVLDNRRNYRRDGLPINAETSIALDNKARIEVLMGLSGMQAGTSAPGGLVNYVVKRPSDAPLSSASLEWRERASAYASVDLSRRFGDNESLGVRLNAAAASLEPVVLGAQGRSASLALAGEWKPSAATRVELEGESSRRSQPSVPGFSLLGNSVPDARGIDPRININNQAWSLPVVLDGNSASLRVTQRLDADWSVTVHAAIQRLRSDDRIAFPFGCSDPNPVPTGTYYPDRYCPDGTLDLYEFRSDGERRDTDALDVSVAGSLMTGSLRHQLQAGLLRSVFRARFGPQLFAFAGTGNVGGTAQAPASGGTPIANMNRDERSTELHVRDVLRLTEATALWLGLRHTRLQRGSVGTDASQPTDYAQSVIVPFVALSQQLDMQHMLYASWGQGVESEVVPNLPQYSNRAQALPALKSWQIEGGIKGATERFEWTAIGFDILRPAFADFGACDINVADSCTRTLDGNVRHRGLELSGGGRFGAWGLRGSSQWLRSRREASQQPGLNGRQPTNVPALTLKGQVAYTIADIPGLSVQANALRESRRQVLPDNSASIPGYTRFDAALRLDTRVGATGWTWRAGVDNLTDTRAWKESPYQFNHAYLFPLAPRTWRLSVQADL